MGPNFLQKTITVIDNFAPPNAKHVKVNTQD